MYQTIGNKIYLYEIIRNEDEVSDVERRIKVKKKNTKKYLWNINIW